VEIQSAIAVGEFFDLHVLFTFPRARFLLLRPVRLAGGWWLVVDAGLF
jgi:hypothetical protein